MLSPFWIGLHVVRGTGNLSSTHNGQMNKAAKGGNEDMEGYQGQTCDKSEISGEQGIPGRFA